MCKKEEDNINNITPTDVLIQFLKSENIRLRYNFDLSTKCIEDILVVASEESNIRIGKIVEEYLKNVLPPPKV